MMSKPQPKELFYLQSEGSADKHRFAISAKDSIPDDLRISQIADKFRIAYERIYDRKFIVHYTHGQSEPPQHFRRMTDIERNSINIEYLTGPDCPGRKFLLRHAKTFPNSSVRVLCDELKISLEDVEPLNKRHIVASVKI